MKTFVSAILALFMASSFAAEKTIPVSVTDKGFEPSQIKVSNGDSIILSVTRKTNDTCATEIKIPSLKIKKELPLNKAINISLGKVEKGSISFSCGMDMVSGVVNIN